MGSLSPSLVTFIRPTDRGTQTGGPKQKTNIKPTPKRAENVGPLVIHPLIQCKPHKVSDDPQDHRDVSIRLMSLPPSHGLFATGVR
jgi:hypothetical protein